MSAKLEYYEVDPDGCRALGGDGDAAQFASESEYLDYFAARASTAGNLGAPRFSVIEEGMSLIATAKNENPGSATHTFGIRANERVSVGEILQEFGIDA